MCVINFKPGARILNVGIRIIDHNETRHDSRLGETLAQDFRTVSIISYVLHGNSVGI
jgi:hypothetical protein